MILRNSLRSIVRSPGKTALFTLLIFALTLALELGVCVWASIAQFLDDCDDYYTTIGLVEYMGAGYPDDTGYDAAMAASLHSFDTAQIVNDAATLSWETPSRSLGYIEGFWRTDTYMPDRLQSVLVVGNTSYNVENDIYNAFVSRALYSALAKDDSFLIIDGDFGTFEPGHTYLVFGEVYRGKSPLLHLRAATFNNAIAAAAGIEVPRMIDITSDGSSGHSYGIPEDSVLVQVADALRVTNNSVLVWATGDLMSLLPFHQQELYITDGRAFTADEYARGSRVAIISELMAARLGIGVGDTIDLSVAVSDQPGVYNSYWVTDGFSYRETFTVVGLVNTVMDKSWYVFVPESAGGPSSPFPIGYTVGHAVIRNEDAAAFSARLEPAFDDRFHLTIYDQGYSTVALPYQTILNVARIVTAVCAFVELAVLVLFGFLFVYRQRETSETMLMLGTGKARVCAYFLYSAGLISLLAAAAGAAAGYWLHDNIITLVTRSAGNFALIDSRFSNGNLTISRTLEFAPDLDWQLFALVGALVFVFAVTACLGFTISSFVHSRPSRSKSWGPRREHRTSLLSGGSAKYAILSMLRGGARSLVVPILAVSVVLFFGQLATTSMRYQEQLEAIYDHTALTGYYTDIHGKQIGNQVLDAYDVASLYHTGQLSALSVTMSEPYTVLGVSRRADGTELDVRPLAAPANIFALEALEEAFMRGSSVTATNDIRESPEFYYASSILLTFLDGYDESILTVPTTDSRAFSCIVSTSFMKERGLELGDTIRVAFNHVKTNPESGERFFYDLDLLVVGSYEKQGTEDTIYVPLSLFFDTGPVWGEGQPAVGAPSGSLDWEKAITPEQKYRLHATVFNSATFRLADSRQLVPFKDHLTDYGYSQVNQVSRVREFIVLNDSTFNNAVASVKQQIRYINTLYPCLYVLVGIIAVVVSYLLIVSRKQEVATIRGLGGTRYNAFFSFFFEQTILCVLGTAFGIIAWRLAWGEPVPLHLMLITGFVGCYFIGCAVSILIMNQSSVLTILLDKD